MSEYYRLEGRTIVPCTRHEWAEDHSTRVTRRVGDTTVKGVRISTVFLGLDHAVGGGRPLIFETVVFGGHLDGEHVHYSTVDEAEVGHAAMVARVREAERSALERAVRAVRP